MAERYLGEALDKSQQKSDWAADELTGEQLEYARKDAEILAPLHRALLDRLEAVPENVWRQDMDLVKAVSSLPAIGVDSGEYERLLEEHTAAFETARKRCNDLGMFPVTKAEVDARKPKKPDVAAHLVNLAWNGLSGLQAKPTLSTRPHR